MLYFIRSDFEMYDFESLRTDIIPDFRKALAMTSDIWMLELIHHIGTCVFEVSCFHTLIYISRICVVGYGTYSYVMTHLRWMF